VEPSLQTVVVLTALPEEYDAVRALLKDVRPFNHPAGTRYEVAELPVSGWRLALANAGEGNQAMAALTERSISAFAPAAVGFAGIAGALDDELGPGDVVVADRVYATHGGREDDNGFRVRPRSWETAHQLLQLAHDVARTRSWTAPPSAGSQAPRVHFAPVAAGEVDLRSPTSPLARLLRDGYNDAAAITNEDAGLAQAAHLHHATPMIVVRGIGHTVREEQNVADRRKWRQAAAANAAAFMVSLLTQFAAENTAAHGGR
jgi:adenosylhomocysteine nucleosidase